MGIIIISAAAFFALVLLISSLFTVEQQSICLIERFGKFVRVARAGLNIKIPFIEQVGGILSLRVRQLDVEIETKTLDDVFVHILTSVQYQVIEDKTFQAFYTFQDPQAQIQSFVFDVVRARVPKIKLDDVFSKKDEIANAVKSELHEVMSEFGYNIIKTLVTDINPDARVKAAMNEINEAQRLRVAANERGEAEKILKVKQAEAESESKILQGQGIAGQRKAIIEGLEDALEGFQRKLPQASASEVMNIVMMSQYFDTIKDLGAHGQTSTVFMPHSPGGLSDILLQVQAALRGGRKE